MKSLKKISDIKTVDKLNERVLRKDRDEVE
jgi:hypothetical protein